MSAHSYQLGEFSRGSNGNNYGNNSELWVNCSRNVVRLMETKTSSVPPSSQIAASFTFLHVLPTLSVHSQSDNSEDEVCKNLTKFIQTVETEATLCPSRCFELGCSACTSSEEPSLPAESFMVSNSDRELFAFPWSADAQLSFVCECLLSLRTIDGT